MYIFVTAFLGAVILLLFYLKTSQKLNYFQERNFPYAKTSVHELLRKMVEFVLRLKSIDAVVQDIYDSGAGMKYFGQIGLHKNEIVIRDPDIIYNIMIKDFSYFMDRPFPVDEKNDPLSAHLFSLKGDRWRGLRYKLAPTFTTGKLRSMFKQLTESSDSITNYISSKPNTCLEVKQLSYCYILDVIASVAFGMKVEAHKYLDGEKSEFVEMSLRFFRMNNMRYFKFFMITFFKSFSKFIGLTLTEDDVKAFFFDLVKNIIKYREETGTKSNDFLQLLINMKEQDEENGGRVEEARKEMMKHEEEDKELFENLDTSKKGAQHFKITDTHLAANTFVFISGGSESTSTALTFALLEIACNPPVQQRMQEEIDSVLMDQELSFSAVNSMTYLNQVVLEVFRKHPPIALLNRLCVQDYKIPDTDHVIRKGDEIILPVSSIHNDPENFPNPEVFDPDRFLYPDSIRKGTYLPFGMGPRFCIAMRFAILSVKVLLVKIFMAYSIKISPKTIMPIKMKTEFFTKGIQGGLWIDFEARN
ncbi:LOW QUALITY PROTEIN: cytochrome P450 9e2 [Nilaparvata lugens]|uniref:Cytochrome P450 CYP6FL3 n=1 Tax=Nilaparvata lugens TaxID=108931 RepID=A0A0K0LBA1_NILLU|nr:LOW QUALITY PROTEIN: cytochrome P450 9e2 [Nilaparvata lugens]AIW79990.1 cytochrome P450 CYP6FL3 [Nilaparvata lugens]